MKCVLPALKAAGHVEGRREWCVVINQQSLKCCKEPQENWLALGQVCLGLMLWRVDTFGSMLHLMPPWLWQQRPNYEFQWTFEFNSEPLNNR